MLFDRLKDMEIPEDATYMVVSKYSPEIHFVNNFNPSEGWTFIEIKRFSKERCIEDLRLLKARVNNEQWRIIEEVSDEECKLTLSYAHDLYGEFSQDKNYNNYTCTMLEELINRPFIRESCSKYYIVS